MFQWKGALNALVWQLCQCEPGERCFSEKVTTRQVWGTVPAGCVLQLSLSEVVDAASSAAAAAAQSEPFNIQVLAVLVVPCMGAA